MRARLYDSAAVRSAAFVGAGGLAVALIVIAFFNPNVAATGWLVGFVFWMQILVGSLTLTMIHRLTGGCWGEIVAPAVELAALAVPFLLLLAIPLFVAIPVIYPWPHRPVAIKPDVLSYYLNAPSFIVRSVVALVGWSALAVYLPRIGGRSGQLLAALGLVFHALSSPACRSIGISRLRRHSRRPRSAPALPFRRSSPRWPGPCFGRPHLRISPQLAT